MELSFDYYKNMQDATLYLCNPDRSLLGTLYATNRNLTLRFNSLSELTFDVPKYITNANGGMIEHPYFERVATKRLIKVDKVGWFRITEATETENSTGAIKSVIAESHESIFKDMGFVEENRLYKFYDATDPYDETYNADDDGAIPSIVGQLYQQLGIRCALNDYDAESEIDYADWTIVWIEDGLKYRETNKENVCRTLKGSDSLFGYDFMITDVGDAFQVLFEFDILHHTIKIKSAATVAQKTNIYLSFDNLIQELAVSERSDEIVTVLACKGTDLDITSVNPMGTNYICDFSYFMGNEENGYPWMSKALTDKLIEWRSAVQSSENSYADLVKELQRLYMEKAEYDSSKVYIEKKLQDIEEIRDQYINNSAQATTQFTAETVTTGEYSREPESVFYKNKAKFNAEYKGRTWYCYAVAPSYDQSANKYLFPNSGVEGTDYITGASLAECFGKSAEFPYFMDGDEKSYCKMKQGTIVDDNGKATYFVDGFDRFVPYLSNGYWYNIYSADETYLQNNIDRVVGDEEGQTAGTINYTFAQMKQIASRTNILSFFDGDETLMRELKCYWVDGNYTNDTLKALEGSTVAENLELAKELMATGKTELNRVCQPRFSFTVTAANFLKMHQFLKFVRELELGKIVTVEKDENTHYYPALTEMTFSLENSEDFSLTFSNSLKLTDWGFTYADLIKSASSTSRAVEANWANLMEYNKNKSEISELLVNSLDRSLRAGLENAYSQEFIVDKTGVLGRKRREDGSFENEQMRMTNNLLVFTRDNWQTAATALGKIVYKTPEGETVEGYGLLTDALIGKLLIGNRLWLGNETNTITLDGNGINIKDKTGVYVFSADSNGNLSVKGAIEATSGSFSNGSFVNCTIEDSCEIKGTLSSSKICTNTDSVAKGEIAFIDSKEISDTCQYRFKITDVENESLKAMLVLNDVNHSMTSALYTNTTETVNGIEVGVTTSIAIEHNSILLGAPSATGRIALSSQHISLNAERAFMRIYDVGGDVGFVLGDSNHKEGQNKPILEYYLDDTLFAHTTLYSEYLSIQGIIETNIKDIVSLTISATTPKLIATSTSSSGWLMGNWYYTDNTTTASGKKAISYLFDDIETIFYNLTQLWLQHGVSVDLKAKWNR